MKFTTIEKLINELSNEPKTTAQLGAVMAPRWLRIRHSQQRGGAEITSPTTPALYATGGKLCILVGHALWHRLCMPAQGTGAS
jgi:hypothetical protein